MDFALAVVLTVIGLGIAAICGFIAVTLYMVESLYQEIKEFPELGDAE